MEILKAENIYKSFGENKVLKGASLTLNKVAFPTWKIV